MPPKSKVAKVRAENMKKAKEAALRNRALAALGLPIPPKVLRVQAPKRPKPPPKVHHVTKYCFICGHSSTVVVVVGAGNQDSRVNNNTTSEGENDGPLSHRVLEEVEVKQFPAEEADYFVQLLRSAVTTYSGFSKSLLTSIIQADEILCCSDCLQGLQEFSRIQLRMISKFRQGCGIGIMPSCHKSLVYTNLRTKILEVLDARKSKRWTKKRRPTSRTSRQSRPPTKQKRPGFVPRRNLPQHGLIPPETPESDGTFTIAFDDVEVKMESDDEDGLSLMDPLWVPELELKPVSEDEHEPDQDPLMDCRDSDDNDQDEEDIKDVDPSDLSRKEKPDAEPSETSRRRPGHNPISHEQQGNNLTHLTVNINCFNTKQDSSTKYKIIKRKGGTTTVRRRTNRSLKKTGLEDGKLDVLVCPKCDKVFTTPTGRTSWAFKFHRNSCKFPCKICDQNTGSAVALKSHVETKHPGAQFGRGECRVCHRKCKLLEYHYKATHQTEFGCYVCQVNFTAFRDYNYHLTTHPELKLPPVKCETCNTVCTSNRGLRGHIQRNHETTQVPFSCRRSGCKFTCRSNTSLKRHINKVHDLKKFPCEICGSVFSLDRALRLHMARHRGEIARKHRCEEPGCGKSFQMLGKLRDHLAVIHAIGLGEGTEPRPFICDVCGKGFPISNYLYIHLRSHETPEEKKARRLKAEQAREERQRSGAPVLVSKGRPRTRPIKSITSSGSGGINVEDSNPKLKVLKDSAKVGQPQPGPSMSTSIINPISPIAPPAPDLDGILNLQEQQEQE